MELQLGLALPCNDGSREGGMDLDLNRYAHHEPIVCSYDGSSGGHFGDVNSSEIHQQDRVVPRTLSLLPRSHVEDDCNRATSNSRYVKVAMEGVGIGRKIDLSLHDSFQSLKEALMDMFGICYDEFESFVLTFQDKKGEWLFAGDVTWRTFIRSVQRLKIVKMGNQ